MTAHNVGSVLVLSEGLPEGIITDKDLRNKVVTGRHPIDAPASEIMTHPVITYPAKMTITQAQLAMMKNGIGHLCLTEDGTTDTPVVGILSKYDLMLALGNSPEVLLRAIKRTRKIKRLKPIRNRVEYLLKGYLENNIPMSITMKLIAELNDACIKRVIELSLRKEGKAPVPFAWLAMGSQGRGEQLLHTDQDNALVYEDVPEGESEKVQQYFHQLAVRVNKGLRTIGYEYCPADMMASNPNWCKPLSVWKKTVTGWIHNPGKEEVLLSSIFFDFNFTYGVRSLVTELSNHIFSNVDSYPMFYYHLASGALQNPSPSGFFRQFLLEQDGEHKDFFDLKRRVLMPFTDAARVLILSHQVRSINNTAERFEKLAELEANNREFFLSCSYATKALLKFRTKQGLLHTDSGRFIALDTLSKEEKIKLKRTFKILKELQELISLRFKVTSRVL
jgi:CBS domain-containing protein